jgi:hypothetical protein
VVDPTWGFAGNFAPGGDEFGIPSYTILNRELEIVRFAQSGLVDQSLVDSLLDTPIPEVDWPLP